MSEKIYYVYRHVRLDTNEVFYVGKGTKNCDGSSIAQKYYRAYDKWLRGSYWKRIVKKHGYTIDIIFECHSEEKAFEKEMELINFYGRKDLKKGTLINFTDGGDGVSGRKVKEETKRKISRRNKGAIRPNNGVKKELFAYSLDGAFVKRFLSRSEAALELDVSVGLISMNLKRKTRHCKNMIFYNQYKGEQICIELPAALYQTKPVECFDKELVFIGRFNSMADAAKFTGLSVPNISWSCRFGKFCRGFLFKKASKT